MKSELAFNYRIYSSRDGGVWLRDISPLSVRWTSNINEASRYVDFEQACRWAKLLSEEALSAGIAHYVLAELQSF